MLATIPKSLHASHGQRKTAEEQWTHP